MNKKLSQYDVVIVPSLRARNDLTKHLASEEPNGNLGTAVHTFPSLVADLWELHGDGRTIINQINRLCFIAKAFQDVSDDLSFRDLSGIATKVVKGTAGAEPGQPKEGATLHPREEKLLDAVGRYFSLIQQLGFIEHNEAMYRLRLNPVAMGSLGNVLVEGFHNLTPQQQAFVDALGDNATTQPDQLGEAQIRKADDDINLRFTYSAGEYGTPQSMLDTVLSLVEEGNQTILVSSPSPAKLHRALSQALYQRNIACQYSGSVALTETAFGSWIYSCLDALLVKDTPKSFTADVLLSPFSGVSTRHAFNFDANQRIDRLKTGTATRDEALQICENIKLLQDAFESQNFTQFADAMAHTINQVKGESYMWKDLQRACLSGFIGIIDVSAKLRMRAANIYALLDKLSVSDKQADQPDEVVARVIISDPRGAKEYASRSMDAVVIADLTNDNYTVSNKDDSADLLLEKIGLSFKVDAFDEARKSFNDITKVAARNLVLHRKLNDQDGEEAVPAMVLEEFIDCYRQDVTATDDIDNPYRLPAQLQSGMGYVAEDKFAEGVLPGMIRAGIAGTTMPELDAQVTGAELEDLLGTNSPFHNGEILLSPSRIETYMDCPYRWFVSKRLNPSAIDEQFSVIEKGSYTHAVLQRFLQLYRKLTGSAKPTPANIEMARIAMDEAIEQVRDEQPEMKPGSGRYVARDSLERQRVTEHEQVLKTFVDFETQLLPTFSPTYFEYEIPREEAVEYAGIKVFGTVDRIDIDDKGRAIIIDYKGSIKGYHTLGNFLEGAGKVQALIYAQIIRKHLGLDVVGAIYVSTKKNHRVAGAIDGNVVEVPHIPGLMKGCVLEDGRNFGQLLDDVEAQIAQALEGLKAGKLPRTTNENCQYCDCVSCPKRGK